MKLADRLNTHPQLFLWLFTAWYALGEVCLNLRRPFWFDEITALSVASTSSIGQVWNLIDRGIEMNPPLPFWIQWIVTHLVGEGELASRVPAIAGFWLMCVCLYHLVRRRADAAFGFMAMLFPVFTYTSWNGTYARSYGLLLGFSGAALLSWQFAAEGLHRRRALAALALAGAATVSSHYYGLYVIGAIGLGELARNWERRRLDEAVWTALAVGLTPLVFCLPLIRGAAGGAKTFWVTPDLSFIQDCYQDLFGAIAMLLLLWLWYAVSGDAGNATGFEARAGGVPRFEAVAYLALLAMPLVVGLAAQVAPIPFYPRYVQPVVLGAAPVVALFVYRVAGGTPRLRNAALGLLVLFAFVPWGAFQVLKMFVMTPPREVALSRYQNFLSAGGPGARLPLVMDGNGPFLMLYHYASAAQRERLVLVSDYGAAVRFLGSDTTLRALEVMDTVRPVHRVEYRDFVDRNPRFFIAVASSESWMVQQLRADGARLQLSSYEKGLGPFALSLWIFEVEVAPGVQVDRRVHLDPIPKG